MTMGKNVINCKKPGGGQIVKLCNNQALFCQMLSICEALALGEKLGMDPKLISDIMRNATGRCWSIDAYNPIPGYLENVPASRDYTEGFSCTGTVKDLTLSTNSAKGANANVDLALLTKKRYEEVCEIDSTKDFGFLYQLIKKKGF